MIAPQFTAPKGGVGTAAQWHAKIRRSVTLASALVGAHFCDRRAFRVTGILYLVVLFNCCAGWLL